MAKCWEESLLPSYCVLYDCTAIIAACLGDVFFYGISSYPIVNIVYNLALIRLDALKLCYTRQRLIAEDKYSGMEDAANYVGVWVLIYCIMGITSDILQTHCGWYGVAGIVISSCSNISFSCSSIVYTAIPRSSAIARSHEKDRRSIERGGTIVANMGRKSHGNFKDDKRNQNHWYLVETNEK